MRSALVLFGLLLILAVMPVQGQKDVWRVEPPCWWVGMANTELQIMMYGDGIGEDTPVVNHPGVVLTRVERTDNRNYLFLYFTIDPTTAPGSFLIELSEQTIPYHLKARKDGSADRQGFGQEDVIYLITPDRFANGDLTNDAFPDMADKLNRSDPFGRHGGDLKGIIQHLDYLEEMGFTALWLNPVVENDMPSQSYHGYAATDFYAIDPRYGTNDDYRQLSLECQKRGMKLIMDQIMNHCGSYHWWMKDLPDQQWIHSVDTYRQTSHQRVVLNDPYAAQSDIKRFTEGWFVPTMPDLNQGHPLLADYLVQNSIWWVEEADLGGIRHDTHPYAGKEFMQEYSCRIMEEYPNFTIVGEEWSIHPAIIAKWQRGKNNPDGYVSCMPSMFDFPLQVALNASLREEESWNTGWIKVYEALSADFLYADPFQLVTFVDNHDMDRFFTQIGEDLDLYKMGMAYLAGMRGIPQIYYGTELLMTNAVPGNHGLIRSDFPGGWPGDKVSAFTPDNLDARGREAQDYLKQLLNWRKQAEVIHHGRLMHYAPYDETYLFFRYLNNEAVMFVFNKGKKKMKFDPALHPEMLEGVSPGRNVLSQQTVDFNDLILPPRSVQIIAFSRNK